MAKVPVKPWAADKFTVPVPGETTEFRWDEPEPLALITEETTDGDRIVADRQRRLDDQRENDKKQTEMEIP
jgi:hypothetical protein